MIFATLMMIHENICRETEEAERKHREAKEEIENFRKAKGINDWGSNVLPEDRGAYEDLQRNLKVARENARDCRIAVDDFLNHEWN